MGKSEGMMGDGCGGIMLIGRSRVAGSSDDESFVEGREVLCGSTYLNKKLIKKTMTHTLVAFARNPYLSIIESIYLPCDP